MCDNPIPPTPSAEGVGGNGFTHSFHTHPTHWMRVKWCINNGTNDDGIIEWEKNERYFWVTSIFHSHSGFIPSFLMRKNEKNQIPPTRDQKIVTLDWMNSILNDGKAEGRGNFLNKGQPLRFFSSSFHSHFTVFSSFYTHPLSEIIVECVTHSFQSHPTHWMRTKWCNSIQ